jgi:LPS sulfotransferase NodH
MMNGVFFSAIRSDLESVQTRAALVFDDASLPSVSELVPQQDALLVNIDRPDELPDTEACKSVGQWYAFSIVDEARVRGWLATYLSDQVHSPNVRSCINDVLAGYLTRDLPCTPDLPPGASMPDLTLYAILCAPRCGSTYFGEMLESVGLGRPEEHIRERAIAALADLRIGEADAHSLLKIFEWRQQRNLVFGTKAISHFIFELLAKVAIPGGIVEEIRQKYKLIYLVRRDKVRQAVSGYLADSVKVWHVRNEKGSARLNQKHAEVEYHFEEILRRYRFLVGEDKKLAASITGIDHHLVCYEDMVANPAHAVAAAAKFLGFDDIGTPNAKVMKVDSPATNQFYEQFIDDYRERFGRDPEYYLAPEGPRTEQRLAQA